MKRQLLKRQTEKYMYWLDMIELAESKIQFWENELAIQEKQKFPYMFTSKREYLNNINNAKDLLNFCVERFNKLKIDKIC
jgi:hypothetical protein